MPINSALLAFTSDHRLGALTTLKRDGRPQLSMITYAVDTSSPVPVVGISVTDDRAKVANLRRDPRASLLVTSKDGWSYAVLEGDVELSPVARTEDDATVAELVQLYGAVTGEHPDWEDYRRAMVRDKRLVARLRVGHTYGTAG